MTTICACHAATPCRVRVLSVFPLLQALEVIRLLKSTMQIERARMKLRVTVPSKEARKIRDRVLGMVSSTEHEEWDLEWILVRFCVYVHVWRVCGCVVYSVCGCGMGGV